MNSNIILNYVIFTGLFYALYKALFGHLTFFQWNRILLLAMPLTAFLIAFFAPQFNTPVNLPAIALPQINVTAQEAARTLPSSQSNNWMLWLYLAGCTAMAISMLWALFRIFRIIHKSRLSSQEGITYFVSDQIENPFTFFTIIILPASLSADIQKDILLTHENAHRKQKHSLDNIFYGLLNVISWFNPFTHLLAKELRMVHEAQADAHSLTQASHEEYARMLLSSTFGSPGLINRTVSPFFNSSILKNRITMLYKKENPNWMRISYAFILPLMAGMMLFACNKVEETEEITTSEVENKAFAFSEVDRPPLFENCDPNAAPEEQRQCFQQGIVNHIVKNFKYPEIALEKGLSGIIYVNFIIDKNGNVKNTEVKNWKLESESGITFNPQTVDEETVLKPEPAMQESFNHAKSIVKSLPKFKPALINGEAVNIQFIIPISMKLN